VIGIKTIWIKKNHKACVENAPILHYEASTYTSPYSHVSLGHTTPELTATGLISGQSTLFSKTKAGQCSAAPIKCHYCKEPGHVIARCFKRQQEEHKAQENICKGLTSKRACSSCSASIHVFSLNYFEKFLINC
jgi:hypothetical protein